MKILAVNGSPRGNNGMTWWVLSRFLAGAKKTGAEIETITLAGKKIHYCTGEFACWLKTPGRCIHRDDMEALLGSLKHAEKLVVATPVYVDGMTGLLKNFADRTLPLADPHIMVRDGHMRHRTDESVLDTIALVSVCGFHEVDNFDPLVAHVKAISRNMGASFGGAVLRPAAPALPYLWLMHPFKMKAVIDAIGKAGEEFATSGTISEDTASRASADVVPPEVYMKYTNRYFDKELQKITEK